VMAGDDEASLSARVLKLEHRMYPQAVRWFVEGRLEVAGGLVRQLDGLSQSFI
jgi:phosphoribosylglycinamide formyltransferase-1